MLQEDLLTEEDQEEYQNENLQSNNIQIAQNTHQYNHQDKKQIDV